MQNIKKNGVQNAIKYVEYRGTKYIVDGHHRARAARALGLDSVPVEKVSLPYGTYKSVSDFFY